MIGAAIYLPVRETLQISVSNKISFQCTTLKVCESVWVR